MENIKFFSLLILILITIFTFCNSSGLFYKGENIKCASIFSQKNHTGFNRTIMNGERLPDLKALLLVNNKIVKERGSHGLYDNNNISESWDNNLNSITLKPQCMLQLCTKPNLEGDCQLETDSKGYFVQTNDTISSVGCVCFDSSCTSDTCKNIQLGRKECGRAFYEENCQSCGGLHMTLVEKGHSSLGKHGKNIRSIFIKRNCIFTAYTEDEFEGDETILSSDFQSDWNDTIRSYTCECSKEMEIKDITQTNVTKLQDPNGPVLIDIPSTMQGILNMSSTFPNHIGLFAAATSARNKRSTRNAYILVLGLSGSGKSATINFLFDNAKLAKVGATKSTTEGIHEYRIPIQVDELGCKNFELRVIDTPGLGDTSGFKNDAKFLAGLEQYLINHEELSDKIPNVVLIFSKFPDNRMEGSASAFVRAIREIDLFRDRLFDLKFSNAIIVLTHYMMADKNIRKNPIGKINIFRETIEKYTLIPKPWRFVLAENKPDDLPIINGYYLLPNMDIYPKNLFDQIQQATAEHDPIGEIIIRNAFKNPYDFVIKEHFFPIHNATFPKEGNYLHEIIQRNLDIQKTEVSNITETVYNNQISAELKQKYPASFHYLQRILNLQKITTFKDIPKSKVGIVKLFKNIRHDALIEDLLEKTFGLRIQPFQDYGSNLIVGQSYNVLTGNVLSTSPLLLNSFHSTDIGYKIPTSISCALVNHVTDTFNWYETLENYLKSKVISLGLENKINANLSGSPLPGNNIKNFIFQNKSMEISYLREYRLFQLSLGTNYQLSPEFKEALTQIPEFINSNETTVGSWNNFFKKYGTHVVIKAFGGGGIDGRFKVENQNDALYQSQEILQYFKYLENIQLSKTNLLELYNSSQFNISNYRLHFYGGDANYHVSHFFDIDKATNILDKYIESLLYEPIILRSTLDLKPLSDIVRKSDTLGSNKIIKAMQALFNSSLSYKPPPTEVTPPERTKVKSPAEIQAELIASASLKYFRVCAEDLMDTEPTREEHYAKFYTCNGKGCLYAGKTYETSCTYDVGGCCWSRSIKIDFNTVEQIRVDVYEADVGLPFGGDDYLGTVYVTAMDLLTRNRIKYGLATGGFLELILD